MRYGDLEDLLVGLIGGEQSSVLGRFRNLRQMPFPDAIRTGTGTRVEYDLPRVLAFCATFEINALLIPQSQAVAAVQGVWPELVRGFIAGAVELGIVPKPDGMPSDVSAIVSILPDSFAPDGHPAATAANLRIAAERPREQDDVAYLRIDCARLMALILPRLEGAAKDRDGAPLAFGDLDRSFGWSKGLVPHRAAVADMFSGSSFLDRGPYLERASAFLRIAATLSKKGEDPVPFRRRSRQAAQNLLDYLGRPSPIDEWKGEIGTEEGRPRLKHFLAEVGETAGLRARKEWPGTILATTADATSEKAAVLIERALALERERQTGSETAVPT